MPLPKENNPYPPRCPCLFHNIQKDTPYLNRSLDARGVLDSSHRTPEVKDPSADIIEWDKIVSITTEIPGCSEKDIDLEITIDKVIIKVDAEDSKYYNEIELPCEVDINSAKSSYQNGVLDIELKKIVQNKKKLNSNLE